MPWDWEECVKQGDESFEYMVNHFHNMFEGEGEDKHVKELSMGYTDTYTNIYYEKIADEYYEEFEKLLVPWIYQEFESKRLLERDQWNLFRDAETFIDTYIGYKRLFLHKHFYFQLIIASYNRFDSNTKDNIYFELNLYGWKEENSDMLYPKKRVSIPLDNMMPDLDWNRK